ncbi:hypothetical protein DWG18_04545 [Lysobacter sp. TY2-98]|uniref:hypothetical protein n=1 Tax=Lysobacter sp. TY2-98 TaxID=2290922 RepID=UPI000E209920|nr:hypothetical protein [Lysobacter sp. TY2-98]AXK71632.1 hypothetical protein DWG18_04545 [Lysobacter sp. TY2-98]
MRLELGASRALSIALVAIGVIAGLGLFLTDLPTIAACAAAPACAAWGFALAARERQRATRTVMLRADGTATVDDERADDLRIDWQGPIASVIWRQNGRGQRIVAWPDVVDAPRRRELRLWSVTRPSRAAAAAVAP